MTAVTRVRDRLCRARGLFVGQVAALSLPGGATVAERFSMAPVTRSRVHKGDWANLPADIILAVARAVAANGGTPLAALQGTCAPWRDAVANEENTVWEVAAIADYPRISSIIGLSGTVNVPYRELYARQARAEDMHITTSHHPSHSPFFFSDFISCTAFIAF